MTGCIIRYDHSAGSIPDYHEPVWLGESIVRDKRGRPHRNAHTRFAVVICNNPGCTYEALINAETVASMAGVT